MLRLLCVWSWPRIAAPLYIGEHQEARVKSSEDTTTRSSCWPGSTFSRNLNEGSICTNRGRFWNTLSNLGLTRSEIWRYSSLIAQICRQTLPDLAVELTKYGLSIMKRKLDTWVTLVKRQIHSAVRQWIMFRFFECAGSDPTREIAQSTEFSCGAHLSWVSRDLQPTPLRFQRKRSLESASRFTTSQRSNSSRFTSSHFY